MGDQIGTNVAYMRHARILWGYSRYDYGGHLTFTVVVGLRKARPRWR